MYDFLRYVWCRFFLRHPLWCRCGWPALPCRDNHGKWAIR